MRVLIYFLFAVFLCCIACQPETDAITIAADAALQERGGERPFKGNMTLYLTPADIPQCDCEDVLPGPMVGAGTLPHLGLSVMETEICFEILNPIQARITDQCVVFTAANGDELWASAEVYDIFFNLDCFCNSGTGVFNFTGGTGRFIDSSGETDFSVVVDIDPTLFIPTEARVEMSGRIRY